MLSEPYGTNRQFMNKRVENTLVLAVYCGEARTFSLQHFDEEEWYNFAIQSVKGAKTSGKELGGKRVTTCCNRGKTTQQTNKKPTMGRLENLYDGTLLWLLGLHSDL